MSSLVIYIHGFLSSPLSLKAEETRNYLVQQHDNINFIAPQLSNYPDEAFAQLQQLIAGQLEKINASKKSGHASVGLIGSSLGGFYATALAEQFSLRAVLVNPAVNPAEHRFITRYQGDQLNPYTGERFVLTEHHRQALAQWYLPELTRPENLWLMAQTADEVLDYRQAKDYYRHSPQLIEQGGDHRFQGFDRHLPAVIRFLFPQ